MIIARTPFRYLIWSGSDFSKYYNKYKGKVIGFTFNRYNYVLFNQKLKNSFKYKPLIIH